MTQVIKNILGSIGGVVTYFITKAAIHSVNFSISWKTLPADIYDLLPDEIKQLPLNKIKYKEHSSLPPNWFIGKKRFIGMTFGYTLFFAYKIDFNNKQDLLLLIHELVHSLQYKSRNCSELHFASDYGKGVIDSMSYRNNPLEIEAYKIEEEARRKLG
jgi:hypothetical protein